MARKLTLRILVMVVTVCAFCLQLAPAAFAQAQLPITIEDISVEAVAGVIGGPQNVDSAYGPLSVPSTTSVTAVNGYTTATTVLDCKGGDDWAVFRFGIEHSRDGSNFSIAQSMAWDPGLLFTANKNTTYSLSGDFTLSGGRDIFWAVTFSRQSETPGADPDVLFDTYDWSQSTQDESFLLGSPSGDFLYDLDGDLNGNLEKDKVYLLEFMAQIVNGTDSSDAGATASGEITLTIGEVPAAAALQDALTEIDSLSSSSFHNINSAKPLTNKINEVLEMIDQGLYQDAIDKLKNDILKKTDGCATIEPPAPDYNDWITDCVSQDEIYQMIVDAIEKLEGMI